MKRKRLVKGSIPSLTSEHDIYEDKRRIHKRLPRMSFARKLEVVYDLRGLWPRKRGAKTSEPRLP